MPFLPKIYYYFNCFRTGQPPTRVWETISRAGWSSSADAADNPLFAHMPYLWNLRPEHQRIWAHQKQTQTIQWPRVPPNGMACKVITNDQFQLSCLPQRSAWKLPAGKQARKKSPARGKTTCPWIEGRHKSQTAPTKSLTSLFDKFYCLLPLLLQPRPKSLSRQPMRNTMPSVLSDREPQAMHGIKGIGRSSCGRTGNSFVFKPRGAEDPHAKKLPNVSSEILEKQHFSRNFREILLPAAASSKTASKKSAPGGKTPCLWVPKPRQKTA